MKVQDRLIIPKKFQWKLRKKTIETQDFIWKFKTDLLSTRNFNENQDKKLLKLKILYGSSRLTYNSQETPMKAKINKK
jgi:hypothetical protein